MNNYTLQKTLIIAMRSFIVIITLFISACADTNIVTLEKSVEQTNNLIDYDNDGVIKARDKCDSTVINALIDNDGCGTKKSKKDSFSLQIHFENNSYLIPSNAYSEIKQLAKYLDSHPEENIKIEGHTSKVGSNELNQKLSENRAKAVEFVLVNEFNIDSERVSAIGYGFEKLIKDGDTEEIHAANRRINGSLAHSENIDELKWNIYTVDKVN